MVTGTRLTITAWLLLCSAIATPLLAQDISLPAEFLFGRWTSGHHFNAGGTYADNTDPVQKYGYTYTSNSFRITLDSLARNVYYGEEDGRTWSAPISLAWRPDRTMQLGIDDFRYIRFDEERTSDMHLTGISTSSTESSVYAAQPHFYFVNADSFTVSPEHARYWYLVDEFLMPGQFVSRSAVFLQAGDRKSTSIHWPVNSDLRELISNSESDSYRLVAENHFRLGLPWHLNLGLFNGFDVGWGNYESLEARYYGDTTVMKFGNTRDMRFLLWSYDVQATAMPLSSLYTSLSLIQDYRSSWASEITQYTVDDSLVFSHSDVNERPFNIQRTTFTLRTDYLTAGAFNPAILIDDYQNFYGHQLFAGQTHLTTELRYDRPANRPRYYTLAFTVDRGLTPRLQIGAYIDYRYVSARHSRGVSSELTFQYRSYDYHPYSGPGWARDSRYDIAFGAIPAFRQWLMNLRIAALDGVNAPGYATGMFNFNDLDFDPRFDHYELTHTLGLGRRIAVTSTHDLLIAGDNFGALHIAEHSYSLGLIARPIELLHISTSVSYDYIRDHSKSSHLSYFDREPTWNLQLQALL